MKFLAMLCLMAAGANAQFGMHGIVMPDGKNIQFTREQHENILYIGPSAVIMKDGNHVLLDRNGLPRTKRGVELEGPSGVIFKNGQLRHLPRDVYIVLNSKSGAVLSNGDNVQFRKKRTATSPLIESLKGSSGYVTPTGQLYQLPPGVTVAIEGKSSALLSDGTAIQFFE